MLIYNIEAMWTVWVNCLTVSFRVTTDTTGFGVQYAHAGKIKVPIEAVPTVNVVHGASISKVNESQSSSSPPASEGTARWLYIASLPKRGGYKSG